MSYQDELLAQALGRMRAHVDALPDTGEGGTWDRRSHFLWQLEDDLRRLADPDDDRILSEFIHDEGSRLSRDQARLRCLIDAERALERWGVQS